MADKAKIHKIVSYWKSGFRLLGYALLLVSVEAAAVVLFFSELLGVAEEVWGA